MLVKGATGVNHFEVCDQDIQHIQHMIEYPALPRQICLTLNVVNAWTKIEG